ncbi:hypothetical protein MRB53_038473 [Persea americana]|nr:hypothetical protein MRB53_038473 [Persea americana]
MYVFTTTMRVTEFAQNANALYNTNILAELVRCRGSAGRLSSEAMSKLQGTLSQYQSPCAYCCCMAMTHSSIGDCARPAWPKRLNADGALVLHSLAVEL